MSVFFTDSFSVLFCTVLYCSVLLALTEVNIEFLYKSFQMTDGFMSYFAIVLQISIAQNSTGVRDSKVFINSIKIKVHGL
jgi:hypothetical protein